MNFASEAEKEGGKRVKKDKQNVVKIQCDASEVTKAEKKVRRLSKLLKEANALVDELASKEIKLKLNI